MPIIKNTSIVVEAISRLFDNKDEYALDMFQSGRSTSIADPGRPSVANTIGTVLLNLAANGDYVTGNVLDDAIIQTGDRTLSRNRCQALRTLLEDGDFIERRVKGGGVSVVLFPSETLLQTMFTRMSARKDNEKKWGSARSRLVARDARKKRSSVKQRQLTRKLQVLQEIASDLGYKLKAS